MHYNRLVGSSWSIEPRVLIPLALHLVARVAKTRCLLRHRCRWMFCISHHFVCLFSLCILHTSAIEIVLSCSPLLPFVRSARRIQCRLSIALARSENFATNFGIVSKMARREIRVASLMLCLAEKPKQCTIPPLMWLWLVFMCKIVVLPFDVALAHTDIERRTESAETTFGRSDADQ